LTGTVMTHAYHQAYDIIKSHVNAADEDVLLFAGFGMTAVINKFQRILGLRVPEKYIERIEPAGDERPLIIITHMEHHSNQTSWEECMCDVKIVRRKSNGLPDLNHLEEILKANASRKLIIGSFTACSNVTGIITPYYQMAEIVHRHGGYCFVDFSASAPYVDIDMHPENPQQKLDAIFFSPHKFLGGPGSSGVIIFDRSLYDNSIPDHPGGGTVLWTNPWGEHRFFDDIEIREDGGTPGFLQAIKASLSILLKEEMGVEKILASE
ncbi:MAG: aminotransferase class V-fold PLP-dependent enzyme, partial [Calditrichaeota bacterium]|nr:aminotransferase class V-fold PLP-dependent enzyme [Calditrichota bacterium]